MDQPLTLILIGVFAFGALGHLFWGDARPPSLKKAVVKTSAVAALAAFAWLAGAPLLLVIALALSALGDALLVGEGDRWLLPGMAAIFSAHAVYVALFWLTGIQTPEWGYLAGFALVGGVMLGVLWAHLGKMRWPVVAYVAIIVAMGAAAATLQGHARWALTGAAFFMLSDGVLSLNLFRLAPGSAARIFTGPIVWLTYLAAQVLILWAFLPEGWRGSGA